MNHIDLWIHRHRQGLVWWIDQRELHQSGLHIVLNFLLFLDVAFTKVLELLLDMNVPLMERHSNADHFLVELLWTNIEAVVRILVLLVMDHLERQDRHHEVVLIGIPLERALFLWVIARREWDVLFHYLLLEFGILILDLVDHGVIYLDIWPIVVIKVNRFFGLFYLNLESGSLQSDLAFFFRF